MVGMTGFEPATSTTPLLHSTKLSYIPTVIVYKFIIKCSLPCVKALLLIHNFQSLCYFNKENIALASLMGEARVFVLILI